MRYIHHARALLLAGMALFTTAAVATQPDATLSVMAVGAVGDGSADDSAAIQAAMDFVQADATLAGVYFPPGFYRIASDLTMRNAVSLFGDRTGLSVIQADPDADRLVGNNTWSELTRADGSVIIPDTGKTVSV